MKQNQSFVTKFSRFSRLCGDLTLTLATWRNRNCGTEEAGDWRRGLPVGRVRGRHQPDAKALVKHSPLHKPPLAWSLALGESPKLTQTNCAGPQASSQRSG